MLNGSNTVIDGRFIHCKECGRTVGKVRIDLAGGKKILQYNETNCKNCNADVMEPSEE